MARSAALNPASMPFFPGGLRPHEEEGPSVSRFAHRANQESDFTSSSLSSSEYRSVRSSPSPTQEDRSSEGTKQAHSPFAEGTRHSPTQRQVDSGRSYEPRTRELSILGSLNTLPEDDDVPVLSSPESVAQPTRRGSPFFAPNSTYGRERLGTPPVPFNNGNGNSRSPFGNAPGFATSPVSSLDSGSQFGPSPDNSFSIEGQLKASPIILDIIDRLARYEFSTREIQRDLSDVHRKVNLLLERSLGGNAQGQPEFKDPFAPANNNGPGISAPVGLRGSIIGGIAPNQSNPSDDITQISQRLNTLTSSVGQLLALQTQQHMQSTTAGLPNNSMISGLPHQSDLPPNQLAPTPTASSGQAIMAHALPNRPDLRPGPRVPNPPMRTWSVGALDLPMRPIDTAGLSNRQNELLRDKRRTSVTGLMRRDSIGLLESPGDWPGGSPRDSGPMVSKWDQLSLAPELLRSLSKFGVGPPNKIQQRALPFLLRGADIIAQAPPTQERIAAYVIPAIQVAVVNTVGRPSNRGPIVIMVSTTVDQATQAQRMIRDLGGPINIRSALGVGSASLGSDLQQELRTLHQNMPHIICGTPQKLHALFTSPGGLNGSEVRFLVLDEVDQLIARNLHEFVFNIVKLLPPPRSRALGTSTPTAATPSAIPHSSFPSGDAPATPLALSPPFHATGRRMSSISPSPNPPDNTNTSSTSIERQTALFSNTVPQDVLNLASAIQLREPVRVLVRRDGNVTHADTSQGSRGLRQFYLYLAFTAGGRSDPLSPTPGGGLGIIGSGRGASSAESAQAREWKLDALADLFDDVEVTQAIVHVGGMTALDSVVYKLASRGLEAVPLHGDMNAGTKLAALNKFRSSASVIMRQPITKVLVVYDVQVKTPEVAHIPLIINYDLPKAVEEYAHRVAPAIASNYSRAGVVVNFVTATGGDVEMLRSIECFYKIKCPEVPMSLRDIV